MENENESVQSAQGASVDELKKMLEDIQKDQKPAKKRSREETLAKIFTPRSNKEYFRPLPPKKGRERVETAFFHVVATNMPGGKKKFRKLYCPAHNDAKVAKLDEKGLPILDQAGKPVMIPAPCPMCARYNVLISKQNQSLKNVKKEDMTPEQAKIKEMNDKIYKEAVSWQAKKFYIIRGIDKGVEKDGVKFWRFKHNFKKQGVMDKLSPVLVDFMDQYKVAYFDAFQGTDLSITVTDAEFMGRTYKDVSAISSRGMSKLHTDEAVMKKWLEDDISWREVFKPAAAPNITPLEYLEMVLKGQDPYWDDSDVNNKHWVFPGNPELEAKANTRTGSSDGERNQYFEQASDLVDEDDLYVTPTNVTKEDVGTYVDNSVSVSAQYQQPVAQTAPVATPPAAPTNSAPAGAAPENYEDLPF
jgi:hypothetical protein